MDVLPLHLARCRAGQDRPAAPGMADPDLPDGRLEPQ